MYDTLQVEVTGKTNEHEYLLRASGSTVKFAGFMVVYEEAKNEDVKSEDEDENVRIPAGVVEGVVSSLETHSQLDMSTPPVSIVNVAPVSTDPG